MENILQNCSGASRATSSQYHTCSALHRRSQGFSKKSRISFHSPTEWASWMPPTPKKDIRSMCAVFAAHGRPELSTESATGSRQCNSLQCSLVHGSGRLDPTLLQIKTDVPEGRGDRTAKTNKKSINEFRDKSTSKCDGREEVTVASVYVMLGRRSSAVLSHLSSWQLAQPPTKPTSIREERPTKPDKNKPTTTTRG